MPIRAGTWGHSNRGAICRDGILAVRWVAREWIKSKGDEIHQVRGIERETAVVHLTTVVGKNK